MRDTSGNCDGQTDPATGTNWGVLTSHDVAVRQAGLSYKKAGQDDLLLAVPVAEGLPRSDGRSQLAQLYIYIYIYIVTKCGIIFKYFNKNALAYHCLGKINR